MSHTRSARDKEVTKVAIIFILLNGKLYIAEKFRFSSRSHLKVTAFRPIPRGDSFIN